MLRRRTFQLTLWPLVVILLIGAAARFHDLQVRSLWADEGWTLVLAEGPTIPDIVQRLAVDQHPPLYFVVIHLWRDLTGSSEFALRMLSALTGLVGVAATYQMGRAMFGRTAGVLAAFFLALSDHHIDLSQDVRHYAQMATLIILSNGYYFRLIQRPSPSRGTRIGYVLTSVALLYSHYLGGYILVCQAIHMTLFVRPWRRWWWSAFHFGAICLAFLPWLPIVIEQNHVRWMTPLYYLNSLPNSHETYIMVRDALLGQQYALTGVLIMLGLIWVYYENNRPQLKIKPISPTVFLMLWLVGYAVMTFYLNSNETRQFLTIRNFILMTPGIAVLVGHGLANLQNGLRAFMIGILFVVAVTTVDTRQLKPPWRDVVQTITDHHNPDEPILMDIWVGDFPGRYYIEQQMGTGIPWLSLREARDEYVTQFLPVLLAYVRDVDAFWVIYWRSQPIDEAEYAGLFDQAGFQRSASFYVDHVGNQLWAYRYDKTTESMVARYDDIITLRAYDVELSQNQLRIQLLWDAETQLPLDYSVSVFVLNSDGFSVEAHDGQPQNDNMPMKTWVPHQPVFDQHTLHLPENLPPGEYSIGVKIYYYQTPDEPLQTDCGETSCDWVILDQISIE